MPVEQNFIEFFSFYLKSTQTFSHYLSKNSWLSEKKNQHYVPTNGLILCCEEGNLNLTPLFKSQKKNNKKKRRWY